MNGDRPEPIRSEAHSPHRVLVVDDRRDPSPTLRELLEQHLPEVSWSTADDASATLAVAGEEDFDAFVLGLRLPDMDGIELCRRLKAGPRTARSPVVLLSSHEAIGGRLAEGLEAGADDFISGPLDPVELAARIRLVLRIKRAEDALRASEERFRALVENSNDITYSTDTDNRITYFSPRAAAYGFQPDELLGLRLCDLADGEHRPHLGRAHTAANESGEPLRFEFRVLRPIDAPPLWLEASGRPVRNAAGVITGVTGALRDVTARRQAEQKRELLERQLRHSVKMEAIGRLAAGVAHDFNNVLTAILGFGRLNLMALDASDAAYGDWETVVEAGTRATHLTRQLLAFSNQRESQPTVLCLNQRVRDLEKMLRRLLTEDIRLEIRLQPSLAPIFADPTGIEQCIMNLVVNARDAMPKGGGLVIQTSGATAHELAAGLRSEVMVTVEDTGVGMDQAVLDHLFEPFFTTKHDAGGTGLGLSVVYGILEQNLGRVDVSSRPGAGSSFVLAFPAVASRVEEPSPEGVDDLQYSGHETVLLVEDDDAVRKLVRRALESCGYDVIDSPDPRLALQVCRSLPEPVQLLVTDVVMPGMNGLQLYDQLSDVLPDLRVVFLSGFIEAELAQRGELPPGSLFLRKPFLPTDLARMVRRSLDTTSD